MNDGDNENVFTEIDASNIRNKPEYTLHTTTAPKIINHNYIVIVHAQNPWAKTCLHNTMRYNIVFVKIHKLLIIKYVVERPQLLLCCQLIW